MDKKKILALTFLILILAIVLGCSNDRVIIKKTSEREQITEKSPEEVLVKEISEGKLVDVYDEYVRLGPGETKENWIIINNIRDKDERFTIMPPEGCAFDVDIVDIPAGQYKIIKFNVRAEEGQKDIRIKDSLNNAYGHARISVIIE